MKTYQEDPSAKRRILRQLAQMRITARAEGIDLADRKFGNHNFINQGFVAAFWVLVRVHKSKRDNIEF